MPFALLAVLFGLYIYQANEKVVKSYVATAKAICLTAESVREQMDQNWEEGVYTVEMLREWKEQSDVYKSQGQHARAQKEFDKMLAAVPVVMAWKSAEKKAKEGNYEFRTPKFNPRNPENKPDKLEARVLKMMEKEGLEEYHEVDPETNSVRYFRAIHLTESCLYCHGNPADSEKYWGTKDGTDPTGKVMENWKVGDFSGAFEVKQDLGPAQAELFNSVMVSGVFVLIGMGVIIAVTWWLAGAIATPLMRAVSFVQAVAAGDLTGQVAISSQDETGQLSKAFNEMVLKLRGIIKDLVTNSQTLTASSEDMSTTSNQLATGAEETTSQATTVAAAGEELSTNIKNMASTAEEMSASANTVASAVEEMSASINEVASNCARESEIAAKANTKAMDTRKVMEELGDAANEIGKVVELISSIADQTNLLALNATIEAASAGEAGKGFAVVANEVKELARQSAAATEQISGQIKNIQAKTESSVTAMEDVSNVIEEVSQIASTIAAAVEEQSATTQEITRTVAGVSNATNELAQNVQESANGASEVSHNIQAVSEAASSTSEGAMRTNESARELARIASDLEQVVQQFKV